MCGICGVFEYKTGRPVDRNTVEAMLDVIRHRGPDDEGVYIDGSMGFGMRRLSIIDLAGGRQPMSNEDGNVIVVFNGEIYNYRELTTQLLRRGHSFSTDSDTEVIVHLYEEYGEECVQHLRGMFAFAIWDVARRTLFLARDRLGIKPLYYMLDRTRIVFGSEIKAILQHPHVDAELDTEGLNQFLALKYVPSPKTMFRGIAALPPGYTLTCRPDGVEVRRYWDLSFRGGSTKRHKEEEYGEQLSELLRESVSLHLRSDVPFGAFLSGGVDSSLITALMTEVLDQPVKTFSVGFEGEGTAAYSELPYARLVAKRYQTDHSEVIVQPQDVIDLAPKIVWHLDQPIGDQASLANYIVAECASRRVKMVLTGEGSDELFAGYARYAGERFSPLFRMIPDYARSAAVSAAARLPGLRRQKIALRALCLPEEAARFCNWFPLFDDRMRAGLLSNEFKRDLQGSTPQEVFATHLAETDARDPVSRMLYLDTKLWLPDDLLARGDKTSMAASLEARVPFLDHKLVEFAASLPLQFKLRGLSRKYLLKKVATAWLPDEILYRRKEGFPIPMSVWFRKEARSFVRDLLSPGTIRRRGIFAPEYVAKMLDEHESGFADRGSHLWGLISVELWHQLFLDRPARVRELPTILRGA